MNPVDSKRAIVAALSGFATQPPAAATTLFEPLGYRSQKRLALTPNTTDNVAGINVGNWNHTRPEDLARVINVLRKAVPWMEENGIPKASIDKLLVDNPRRLFTRPAA